jgi:hypothetical protein
LQYGYWKVAVIRKHRIPASPRHLVPGAFVASLVLLACLAPFWNAALWALLVLIGMYVLGLAVASSVTARRAGMDLLPVLPAVFWCYHFGYGYGFLRGLWDFAIRRKAPAAEYLALTRGSSGTDRGRPG